MSCVLLLLVLLQLALSSGSVFAASATPKAPRGCPLAVLQKCAEPLRELGVPMSKNLVRLLLQLRSPSQLRKSCQAYASVMPCFRTHIRQCGAPSQVEILRQLENAQQFLCSPFSGAEQSKLLAHRACIGRVLSTGAPGDTCASGNASGKSNNAAQAPLFQCREKCLAYASASESAQFTACMVRAWLSEQNLCLIERLRAQCGRDASAFYTQMQRRIFHAKFPLICDAGVVDEEYASASNTIATTLTPTSTQASTHSAIFVTAKKRIKTIARLSEVRVKLGGGTTTMTTRRRGTNATTVTRSTATPSKIVTTTSTSARPRPSVPPPQLPFSSPPPPTLPTRPSTTAWSSTRRTTTTLAPPPHRIMQLLAQSLPFQLSGTNHPDHSRDLSPIRPDRSGAPSHQSSDQLQQPDHSRKSFPYRADQSHSRSPQSPGPDHSRNPPSPFRSDQFASSLSSSTRSDHSRASFLAFPDHSLAASDQFDHPRNLSPSPRPDPSPASSLLPPLLPLPSPPTFPYSPLPYGIFGGQPPHHQQQHFGHASRMFYFEVLPIDEMPFHDQQTFGGGHF